MNRASIFHTSTTISDPRGRRKRIRTIIDRMFSDTVYGIPGDEDGGGEFVPRIHDDGILSGDRDPGLQIGCPFFEEATINLGTRNSESKLRASQENKSSAKAPGSTVSPWRDRGSHTRN